MPSPRRIDVHFHLIPPFFADAVYAAGTGPAIGRFPDWTPQIALDLMDAHGIAVALTSLAQPGVGFGTAESAQTLARRCNEYASDMVARWRACRSGRRAARSTRWPMRSTCSSTMASRCSRAMAKNFWAIAFSIRCSNS